MIFKNIIFQMVFNISIEIIFALMSKLGFSNNIFTISISFFSIAAIKDGFLTLKYELGNLM